MSAALVDERGFPTQTFQTWWNEFAGNLESVLNSQQDQLTAIATLQTQMQDRIDEITAIQSDLSDQLAQILAAQAAADAAQTTANTATTKANAAQADANAAQADANTAQTTANTVKRDDSISTSWTSPGEILSASDAGSSATITIAAHTRKYTDVTSKSVNGGSITGLAYSTTYTVYYDQTGRTGGSVTYHATTDPNTGLANAAAGRHFCGKITTPASGGSSTSGGVSPPSGGGGYTGGEIP